MTFSSSVRRAACSAFKVDMSLSNCAAVISFEERESPDGEVDETPLVLIGRRVGTLLDRACLAKYSMSSAGVGESLGEDKKVWPCWSKGGENCRSFGSGKRSCTDRRFGVFAEATGLAMLQPWS